MKSLKQLTVIPTLSTSWAILRRWSADALWNPAVLTVYSELKQVLTILAGCAASVTISVVSLQNVAASAVAYFSQFVFRP